MMRCLLLHCNAGAPLSAFVFGWSLVMRQSISTPLSPCICCVSSQAFLSQTKSRCCCGVRQGGKFTSASTLWSFPIFNALVLRWSTAKRQGISISSSTLWPTLKSTCLWLPPVPKLFWETQLWQCTQKIHATSTSVASSALSLSWTGL